jgi:putative colanic acid biosynthesis glycosyltransferase
LTNQSLKNNNIFGMKVLQLNLVYKEGSTGKIVYEIHKQLLDNGHSSMVIYGQGSDTEDENVVKVTSLNEWRLYGLYSRLSGFPYSGCFFSTGKILKIIENYNPNVVHLQVINGHFVNHFRLLNYLKAQKIFTVITLHAEFMYTGKCGHSYECDKWKTGCGDCPQINMTPKSLYFDQTASEWKRKKEVYNRFNNLMIVSVSPWLNDRAKQSPFLKDKSLSVIGNGIDTVNVFHPSNTNELRKKHDIKNDEKILLHVTASFKDPLKGGKYILKLASSFLSKKIKIIILGDDGYKGNVPENVILLKHVKDQLELAKYYSMADLTVITSKRETFSMICAESLSCGTPVVGFKAGAPEQISLKNYSNFVDNGDVKSLELCIQKWINMKPTFSDKLIKEAHLHYSIEGMYKKYFEIYSNYQKIIKEEISSE